MHLYFVIHSWACELAKFAIEFTVVTQGMLFEKVFAHALAIGLA